ncbi:unnamed protein product [Closterium sp. Yama58-4]|nr:unnamed protein product [Closterium sp. Yama58-4]
MPTAVLAARAQPMAGPRCVNRFPEKPLCKFVDDLAASPLTFVDASAGETIKLGAYDKFHRDLPPTKVYAFGVSRSSARYPGPVLLATRGTTTRRCADYPPCKRCADYPPCKRCADYPPCKRFNAVNQSVTIVRLLVCWVSNIRSHFPSNPHLNSIFAHLDVITAVHKHGGETPSKSDGHPLAWYTASGEHGPEFESQEHTYPNMQRATMLWYHDHTIGMTAQNVVAGLAGLYVIRDPQGEQRRLKKWLPRGERQLHLVIADRIFFPNGSINYPKQGLVPNVHPNWIPGYTGDTNVVNGKVWPFLKVRRAMHRMRMVNAANARTYNLTFQCAARGDSNFNPPLSGPLLPFHLIGSDGGYLVRPLRCASLLVVPGTRHDLLLDFNAAPAWCRDVILVNSASIPFPVGQPADWFTGVVMRFIINQRSPIKPPALPNKLSDIPPVDLSQAVRQRWRALVFVIDRVSREPSAMLLDGKASSAPATEKAKVGTSELWHIINPTFEAHPIHLHLIQHRPISRRPIDSGGLINGSCSLAPSSPVKPSCFTGPARPVPQQERGWKDTTVAFPNSVLTIFVPFKGQVSETRCSVVEGKVVG